MKKRPLIKIALLLTSVLFVACQSNEDDVPYKEITETYYFYNGQTFVERSYMSGKEKIILEGSDKWKIDSLFEKTPNLSVLTLNSDPDKIYCFNSIEESEKFQNELDLLSSTNIVKPTIKNNARVAGSWGEPVFILYNGLMRSGPSLNFFNTSQFNYATSRYELPDLRNVPYVSGGSWNDIISSMEGGSPPANAAYRAFKVVVWEDPNFNGNSWTIYFDSPNTDFFDGNIHDNRMTSRKMWGDNITSIYATNPYVY